MKKTTKQDGNKLIWMVLLVATLFLLGNNLSQARKILTVSKEKRALEEQISLSEEKNKELERRLSYIQSDDFVQKEAKEKLGLAKPNEVAYIIPELPSLESLEEKDKYVPEKTNPEKWFAKFFY